MQNDPRPAEDIPFREADGPLAPVAASARFMVAHPAQVLPKGFR